MTIEIQFAATDMIYNPAEDSWDDDTREAVHEQLSMQRLNRWMLTAKALEATEVYFMGVKQRGTGE